MATVCAVLTACGGGGDAGTGTATASSGGEASAGTSTPTEPTPAPTTGTDTGNVATGDTSGTTTTTETTTPDTPVDTAAQDNQVSEAAAATATPYSGPATRPQAFRLLTQASFGPTDADLSRAMSIGQAAWLDEQLAKPVRAAHTTRWASDNTSIQAANAKSTASNPTIAASFYTAALKNDDQLRQRVAFALSEIFVVSMQELSAGRSQAVASWLDMLNRDALGNFRTLLDDVALHPAMGLYLSHLGSQKANAKTGSTPDQNFGRELMQLFSIGLLQLNLDGTPKLDANGRAIETYNTDDILGMSAVFTGYNWAATDPNAFGPYASGVTLSPNRLILPMQAYASQHSTVEKRILGSVIAAQATPDMAADRKAALDTLFNHPNVAPFIGRQLIQRLVTSHPSTAYVQRVAKVFTNNGAGVRGDLKAVVRAILIDDEARSVTLAGGDAYGKLREPVLRLTALLRAYPTRSLSGLMQTGAWDDPAATIGQVPLQAPSVFNFYRPGYVPPGGEAAQRSLTLPEMQATTETSVAGYATAMMNILANGAGVKVTVGTTTGLDVQTDYSADVALAANADTLARKVCDRLITGTPPAALITGMTEAINSIAIPKATASNADKVAAAKLNRVRAALLLAVTSPEFIVQK
ncbi:DUF1800 family protein [Ideonella azotifigens]|uniref:DUF1800 family protein n=3 Tax=Ideonella azotifigens TaxID=513160 RepID=A0ABN1KL17_9BURK